MTRSKMIASGARIKLATTTATMMMMTTTTRSTSKLHMKTTKQISELSMVAPIACLVLAGLIFNLGAQLKCDAQMAPHQNYQQAPPPAPQQQQQPHLSPPANSYQRQATTAAFHSPNLTLTNRPIERPTLSALSSSDGLMQKSLNASVESAATDWLMLGGGGGGGGSADDLLSNEGKMVASFADGRIGGGGNNSTTRRSGHKARKQHSQASNGGGKAAGSAANRTIFDDEQQASDATDSNETFEDAEDGATMAGTLKEPECAAQGRYYCTYKEDYPLKLVTEVTKYYKWPLEKLFRDLHAQIMPKLAQDSTGNLVCDSVTRVVRPGWARNTNDRWLVVINTENYHQYVTEVVCQYGSNSRCNFIPPCYYSSCQQRYNTQKLLVIDPANPYRGPFLSEFLFPSCCVCYVPSSSESFQDKYRSSPATIYQRTMQQEAANNLYPPQFKPTGLLEELPVSLIEQSAANSNPRSSGQQQGGGGGGGGGNPTTAASQQSKHVAATGQAPAPGEIRRAGDQYKRHELTAGAGVDFPRLGLADSLIGNERQL